MISKERQKKLYAKPEAKKGNIKKPGESPTSTSTEVKSPTRTSTEVTSPTNTSTQAHTAGNVTVTGGAGDGNVTVHIHPGQSEPSTGQAPATPQRISNNQSADPVKKKS